MNIGLDSEISEKVGELAENLEAQRDCRSLSIPGRWEGRRLPLSVWLGAS